MLPRDPHQRACLVGNRPGIAIPLKYRDSYESRGAVAVAERRAVDLDGVALMAEPAEQGADQRLVAEEVGPLGIVEICGDDRRALAIPLFHQLEEDIGLLRAQI